MPDYQQNPSLAPDASEHEEKQEHTTVSRRHSTPEERLKRALARQQTLQARINGLKTELDEKKRKARNRGLLLIGIVVEQCLKEGYFNTPQAIHRQWWSEQITRLGTKDHATYLEFLQSLQAQTGAETLTEPENHNPVKGDTFP